METMQAIYIEQPEHAAKLAERLCRAGWPFNCRRSHPYPGRVLEFSNQIDFQKERKLFAGIVYRLESLIS